MATSRVAFCCTEVPRRAQESGDDVLVRFLSIATMATKEPMASVDLHPKDDEDVLAFVGERRLLAVLLRDAFHRLRKKRRGHSRRKAREWVCNRSGGARFSFEYACTTLGLEPRTVRRRLGLRAHVPRRVDSRGLKRGSR